MKKLFSVIALVMGMVMLMASGAAAEKPADGEAKKVFVCKYVGKPGVDERLQTGNNPISVSVNAIKDYNGVGSYFNDAQGRSFVLAEDTSKGGGQSGEPSVSSCPAPEVPVTTTVPPTTTPPTTEPPVTTVPPTTEPPVTTTPPVTEPPQINPPDGESPVSVTRPPAEKPPVRTITPQPIESSGQLAETGPNDYLWLLGLVGLSLLTGGIILQRRASQIS